MRTNRGRVALKEFLERCFSRAAAVNVAIVLLYAFLVPIICFVVSTFLGKWLADWQFAGACAPHADFMQHSVRLVGMVVVLGGMGPLVGFLTGMALARRSGAWLPAALVAYTFAKGSAAFRLTQEKVYGDPVETESTWGTLTWAASAFSDLTLGAAAATSAIAVVTGVGAAFLGHYLVNTRWPRPDREQADAPADDVDVPDETN